MGFTEAEAAQLHRQSGSRIPDSIVTEETVKRHKYGRIKKTVMGIVFDSTSEADAFQVLKLWEVAGAISDLRLQPVFTLQERFKDASGKTVKGTRYTADFQFFDTALRKTRYVDVKGIITPAFTRAMRQMKDKHPGVEIEIWNREKVKEMSRC